MAQNRLKITDVTLRDGHQSLFATRMRTEDMLPIAAQMDKATVGMYTAAFQVCGAPYILAFMFINSLILPIAFQRASVAHDRRQIWSADRMLLVGVGAYLVLGLGALVAYIFFGSTWLVMLTSRAYVVPPGTLVVLAFSRYVQQLVMLLHAFFAVHEKIPTVLLYRIVGAVIGIPLCWFGIQWYGVLGAALGSAAAACISALLLCLGPGGLIDMLRWSAQRGPLQSP